MANKKRSVFLPELVDHRLPGAWHSSLTEIANSAVNLEDRRAYVPPAYTPAQKLARLHELGHVYYSPRYWSSVMAEVVNLDPAGFEEGKYDPSIVSTLAKMVEENRIDWLLWSKHRIDLRPAREVFDWSAHPVPDKAVVALDYVLQLAWTVWASRGLGKIPDAPPTRPEDPGTGEFFDKCWQVCLDHPKGKELVQATINGCRAIYKDPTDQTRNLVTLELLKFFPPPPKEEPKPPPEKKEEKELQQEIEEEVKQEEEAKKEQATGVGSDPVTVGHYQIHDHTAGPKRPRSRISRRDTPQPIGTRLAFPQRYMSDRAVFGRRVISEAGIMVDGSGSMNWKPESLKLLIDKMPAVWVGLYSGYEQTGLHEHTIYGRICVLAKRGRFCHWEGLDKDNEGYMNAGNDVDLEALELLATWPKPRLWLSDGEVTGGKHMSNEGYPGVESKYLTSSGRLEYHCDRLMKRAGILRVPDLDTMMRLVNRQRVTLFRSTYNWGPHDQRLPMYMNYWEGRGYTPEQIRKELDHLEELASYGGLRQLEPVSFQL